MLENIRVDGEVKQREALESLLMNNPHMEKKVQGLIRKVLLAARRTIANDAKDVMKSDPRQAYKAVKSAVYRRILGGSVSLYNKRHAKGGNAYEPPRKLQPGQRGGNRRARSSRTQQVMSYDGSDRAFILRFLNDGTQGRSIEFHSDSHRSQVKRGSQGGDVSKYGKTTNTGSRGRIAARNFFSISSHTAMQQAAEELTKLIDDLIKQEMK
jgi:hypothetical protein